ncbi:S8 family serine peptidase [Thalassomonas sp. M1454]|uniref:S8 family serine peptidase n=1 Tax=Thalassomonas sp. M1454 TaxID=2594477 RepID=UPI00117FBF96|nr:S8 family serine peptidase [Thalassomonas sp. M1454]TRX52337.1 S8 family serine peptidase [Thalassomonas sp. M1454]
MRKIVAALPLVLSIGHASADNYSKPYFTEDNDGKTLLRSSEKLTNFDITSPFNMKKSVTTNTYIIELEDEPLATYDGSVSGYDATSLLASKNSNATDKGMINTKSLASKRYKQYLAGKQSETKLHVNLRLKRDVDFSSSYDTVLNGFAVELSKSEAILVRQIDGVKTVEPTVDSHITTESGPAYVGATKVWQGTPDLPESKAKGDGTLIGIIDSGVASYLQPVEDIFDTATLPPFNPSFAAEVDENNDGQIDYVHTNPLGSGNYLGDCQTEPNWCNDKLIGIYAFGFLGRDLVNRNPYDARSETGQDTNGHGTHVASTAAGNIVYNIKTEGEIGGPIGEVYPQEFVYDRISGVAPHANIISFQTCNKDGICFQEFALEAIEKAIELGVDVINYSIGSRQRSPWYDHVSLAYLRAREAGVNVAVSAGNNGNFGMATVKTPGNAPWVMSVAAATHDRAFKSKTVTLSGGSADFELETNIFTGEGATSGIPATEIVYAGDVEYKEDGVHTHAHIHEYENLNHEYEYKPEWEPSEGLDVNHEFYHVHEHEHTAAYDTYGVEGTCAFDSIPAEKVAGKVVFCNRGAGIARATRSFALLHLGAKGLVLTNTNDTPNEIVADLHSIPSIHIKKKDGKIIREWLKEGTDHKVAIGGTELISSTTLEPEFDFSGVMAAFSSRGPDLFSPDYLIPGITAPGAGILASGLGKDMQEIGTHEALETDVDYVYRSGTSMSSPHVAGMMLLITSAHPDWTPAEIQSALMLTAATNVKVYGPIIDQKQTFDPAPLIETGAGMARVDRAIESGLIMSETSTGYLQADPFGDIVGMQMPALDGEEEEERPDNLRDLEKDLPIGWHGKPEQMNIASMSKSDCIESCSWTRTFKATKSAVWEVSFSYTTEGMVLEADKRVISVNKGEEFTLDVTASVNEKLDSLWSDGRVHLTPQDSSIPAVSIPVSVNFAAGSAPEKVEITAHRDTGTADIKGVVTIGTSDFDTLASPLSKASTFTGTAKRTIDPENIFDGMEDSTFVVPLSIPAGSARVVVEILETSSPDVDIYLAHDNDLNGEASPLEVRGGVRMWEATSKALEVLDYSFPVAGDYVAIIHNFGDHYNHRGDDEFDQVKSDTFDDIKLAITVVTGDLADESDKELTVVAPKESFPNSEIPLSVKWNKEMKEGDRLYGSILLGTKEELLGNVGVINVNINRGKDDVALSIADLDKDNSLATFNLTFMANDTDKEKVYQMSAQLPTGALLEGLSVSTTANGVTSYGDAVEFTQDGDVITWTQTLAVNSNEQQVSLVFNFAEVSGYIDITPYVVSILDDSEDEQVSSLKESVLIEGKPIFAVDASATFVKAGDVITLTSSVVDAVIDNADITMAWQQVSGPQVEIEYGLNTITFTAPEANQDQEITFELTGSNGERNAMPVLTTIYVDSEETGSGGSTGLLMLVLSLGLLSVRKVRLAIK